MSDKPFLYKVAKSYFEHYGNKVHEHTFVFPNRRAGAFFKQYLSEIADTPIFSPATISIQEFFLSLTTMKLADRIEMQVILYEIYKEISGSDEPFDDFIFWGEMLINDFNDTDKHLADAKQLFINVSDLKSLDAELTYLSEEQIAAIRRFWSNFAPEKESDTKKRFLEIWEILLPLYNKFRDKLTELGRGYEGMIFRQLTEQSKTDKGIEIPYKGKIVFVGLNTLTSSEITLLEYLKREDIADFYWDYDSPLVCDLQNRASSQVEENLMRFPSLLPLDAPSKDREKIKLDIIGISSGVGQAKHLHSVLNSWLDNGIIPTADKAINTAVVLPDEKLLLPVLYSIPQRIDKINVTMGYTLSHSSISALIDNLAELHKHSRETKDGEISFYFRNVLSILNHPIVSSAIKESAETVKENIFAYNKIVIPASELQTDALMTLIFRPLNDWKGVADYIKDILSHIYNIESKDKNEDEVGKQEKISHSINQEFIVRYYKTVNRLQEVTNSYNLEMTVKTYFDILSKITQSISVPFSGEPLSGLQVMGVLETRAVDFENIVILSSNEGILPSKKPTNSFIPYNLRKGFGLPTYEYQDKTYAYHFYRMISRAKRIFMIYDTRTEGMQTGEVSRYFYQIKYLYSDYFDIRELNASYQVTVSDPKPISIEKTDLIYSKLEAFLEGGERALSPSAINTYLDCPVKFYFQVVQEMYEDEDVLEQVEAALFGTIYHNIMERIYDRLEGATVTADILDSIRKNDKYLTRLTEEAFAKEFFKDKENIKPLVGQNFLIGEIIKKYVKQTLKRDAKDTPFRYVESEKRVKAIQILDSGKRVNLKGSIDRIDEKNEITRIIDYKTGGGGLSFKEMSQLFDKSLNKRPRAIMQVFLYSLMYDYKYKGNKISPCIYYIKETFKDNFSATIKCNNEEVINYSEYSEQFTEELNRCLEEIFDRETPFTHKNENHSCEWCNAMQVAKK